MSDTNETKKINDRRSNMGLPPMTARASKSTRQLTTEDVREYLDELKAIAEKLFPNQSDRDTYVTNARDRVKKELLAEKVQLTDDDQVLILDKITGKVKTAKVDIIKSKQTDEPKQTSKDFFKEKNKDSPESVKLLVDFIKNDKAKSNRDRIVDNNRTARNIDKLDMLSVSFDSLLDKQQTTIKLLGELKNKIKDSSITGGGSGSGRNGGNNRSGGILGGLNSLIPTNWRSHAIGLSLLAGIGAARAVGNIVGGETSPSSTPAIPQVQSQNPQRESNQQVEIAREGETEDQVYERLIQRYPTSFRDDVNVQNDIRAEASAMIQQRDRQQTREQPVSTPGNNANAPAAAPTTSTLPSRTQVTAAAIPPPPPAAPAATPVPQAQSTRPENGSFRSAGTGGNLSVEYKRTADGKHYINSREVDAQTYNRFIQLTGGSDPRRDPRYQQYIRENIARGDDFAPEMEAERRIRAEDRAELSNLVRTIELQPQVSIPTPTASQVPQPTPTSTPDAVPSSVVTPRISSGTQPRITGRRRPQATSTTSEAAAAMVATPDDADVDALGLRPESTQQPINSTEPQIPEDATPVRLDGRVVGYMPAGGGPTITFADNNRQALENVRAQVIGSQLTTPPAALPAATATLTPVIAGSRAALTPTESTTVAVAPTATASVPELTSTQIGMVRRLLRGKQLQDDNDARELAESLVRQIRPSGSQDIAERILESNFTSRRIRQSPIGMLIAHQPVIPGQALTSNQMVAIEAGIMMNGRQRYPAAVLEQYDRQQRENVSTATREPVAVSATPTAISPAAVAAVPAELTASVPQPQTAPQAVSVPSAMSVAPAASVPSVASQAPATQVPATPVPATPEVPAATQVMPSTILDERSSRLLDEFLRVHPRLRERGITGGSPEYNQVRDTLQQYIATRVASGSGSIDDVATKMGMENRLARLLDSPRTQTQIVPQSVPEPTTPSLPESSIQHTATSAVPQTQAVPSASIEVTNSTERLVRAYVNRDRQPNRYEEVINHLRGLYPRGIPDNNMLIESRIRDYFKANPGERQPIPQVSGPIETPPATQQVQPSTEALAGTQAKETSAAELADSNLISSSALTNIADDNAQPILLAKEPITSTGNDRSANTKNLNAPERNIAKDDDVVVNEAVREAELLAREYESNPDLFSNRNLVLRARKVTFSGNSIEFKLPSITATPSQPPSSPGAPGPNPLATLASMPAPAGQAVARETAMSATPAAISMGAAAGAASSTGLVTPTSGRVTSPFGMRSMGDHKGIDYGVPVGTPIVAAHGGTVVEVRESPSYGNMIRIRGDNGIDTLYAHLSSFGVQQGQQVTAGQQIALSGNTGRSTGPHLHFEAIRNGTKIDPAPLLGISGSQSAQSAPSQTPEPAPSSSDASPVASTPATAAASIAPSSEQSAAPAQMMAAPATDGAAVEGASRDNAIAERTPAAASAPNVIDMSGGGASNSSTPPPAYNSSDPNDPGLVEPEDAAERYARLFDMAA